MTTEEIKSKIQYGDYNTLADMLGVRNAATAKMRFVRGNKEAIAAMDKIVTAREEMVKKFRKK